MCDTLLTGHTLYREASPDPSLTADTLSASHDQAQHQLNAWLEQPQRHEQIALGIEIKGARDELKEFLKDVEDKIGSSGTEGGNTKKESHTEQR